MRFHTLRSEQWAPHPLAEVFQFFSDVAQSGGDHPAVARIPDAHSGTDSDGAGRKDLLSVSAYTEFPSAGPRRFGNGSRRIGSWMCS